LGVRHVWNITTASNIYQTHQKHIPEVPQDIPYTPFYFSILFLHVISPFYFSMSFLHFISPCHFSMSFLHVISPFYFSMSFLHFISPCHFSITFLHVISPLHFSISFLHFISPFFYSTKPQLSCARPLLLKYEMGGEVGQLHTSKAQCGQSLTDSKVPGFEPCLTLVPNWLANWI
jgi:hypothetical protein